MVKRSRAAKEISRGLMESYAKEYNGELIEEPPESESFTHATLGKVGRNQKLSMLIKGELRGMRYRMYDYTIRFSRKNQQTQNFKVFEVQLPEPVPHVFIDSTQNYNGRSYAIAKFFQDAQAMELEGDFYKNFIVYTSKRTHIDALAIITPDVMDTLYRYGREFNIEFVNNYLYLMLPKKVFSVDKFIEYDQTLQILLDKIYPRLAAYNTDATNLQPMQITHHPTSRLQYVNPQARRRLIIMVAAGLAAILSPLLLVWLFY